MDFFSPIFFSFFLIVLLLYYQLKGIYQKLLILVASSFFIASLSPSFLIYSFAFILINYIFGFLVESNESNKRLRKIFFNTGLLINIGGLVFFKYLNFIFVSVAQFLNIFHFNLSYPEFSILLPIGISYYTFQGISYLLQIYRGIEKLERNPVIYSNYYLFFPKFLAGPIEQSKNLIPQLKKSYEFQYLNIPEGFKLILWGAFKKLVIADRLAMVVNGVYPSLDEMTGNVLLITFLLQPLQLYCDFSGYTDIALGIGRTFGINLTDNFKRPFFSTSVTEFWQRWHISLSSWCNEYIFKRLTFKNRKWGIWSPVFAVFVTFMVIGLWHGPRWTFVIVGLLQGIAINYEFFTKKIRLNIGSKMPGGVVKYASFLFVYLFFCLTLIFFNSPSLSDAVIFISNMLKGLVPTSFSLLFLTNFDKAVVLLSLTLLFIIEYRREKGKDLFQEMDLWPKWLKRSLLYLLCACVIYLSSPNQEFVYMQF